MYFIHHNKYTVWILDTLKPKVLSPRPFKHTTNTVKKNITMKWVHLHKKGEK